GGGGVGGGGDAGHDAGASGDAGSVSGGAAGSSGAGGAAGETGGVNGGPSAGAGGELAGSGGDATDFASTVRDGVASVQQKPRPAFGALRVIAQGARRYAVESRRDVEPGPFNLPWRSRFRVAAYDGDAEVWAWTAEPDDCIGDVAMHPSGDVTLSLERQQPTSSAYQLVRLSSDGAELGRTTLAEPQTAPLTDFGPNDARPLFRMKSEFADATTAGSVALLPNGEDVVAAILSFVAVPEGEAPTTRRALELEALAWNGASYDERWSRVVEGTHAAEPALWAYDEFRWREQAIRPFLAYDDVTGDWLVGRAWNTTRCLANVSTFAEFTNMQCVFEAVGSSENELLPLAVTRFDATGRRLGTRIIATDPDAAEQVPFGLVAHGGELAVAGAVVRTNEDGSRRTYPDPKGFVDYDGYIARYDTEGHRLAGRDFNLGRGDVLAALRWTPSGILAVGSAGWDRWQGGMSVSRGADPLFAWLSFDGSEAEARVIALSDGSRHFTLHDIVIAGSDALGFGFSDAPMTHSGDGNNAAARTFGPLRVRLARANNL
ncbi:MAG TPA: hypothetical protein VFQ35_24615, partial [Polyangiaceae bacterium]|nr:hypothetical protein [Polyangiaceae bacterium]